MKLLAGAVLAFLTTGTHACIRVHVDATYHPLFGDGVSVKLYDNNDFYCEAHTGKKGANSETHWNLDCPNGPYHIELWSDGKAGRITHQVSGKYSRLSFRTRKN